MTGRRRGGQAVARGDLVLIAEIRNKLFAIQDLDPDSDDVAGQIRRLLRETQEDLLTADVFGAIKYLPRVPYLTHILRAIAERNPHAGEFREQLPTLLSRAQAIEFRFWPSFPTPQGIPGSRTEPDVAMHAPDALILVEAKLHSQFGDNQILRELAVALEQAGDREPFLLLVTLGARAPVLRFGGEKLSVTEYVRRASFSGQSPCLTDRLRAARNRVMWINWQGIVGALAAAHEEHRRTTPHDVAEFRMARDIVGDLMELARMRGVTPFRGIGSRPAPPPEQLRRISLPGIPLAQRWGRPDLVRSLCGAFPGVVPRRLARPILCGGLAPHSRERTVFRGIPRLCKGVPVLHPPGLAATVGIRGPREPMLDLSYWPPFTGLTGEAARHTSPSTVLPERRRPGPAPCLERRPS